MTSATSACTPRHRSPAAPSAGSPRHRAKRRWAGPFQKARLAELARYTARSHANPASFLSGYRARRARIGRKNLEIGPVVLDAIARLLDQPRPVTLGRVAELVGVPPEHCRPAYRAICLRLGQVPRYPGVPHALPPDRLAPWLLTTLGPLPETHLDPDLGDMVPAPTLRASARVATLAWEAVRMAAGFVLALAAARRVSAQMQAHIAVAFAVLDKCFTDTDPREPGQLGKALVAFLTDESLTPAWRWHNWSRWVQGFANIDAYCARQPVVAERYRSWHLAFPATYCKPFVRAVARETTRRADVKRRERSSPIAHDRAAILACYDTRCVEIEKIRRAFDTECAKLRDGKQTLRNGRMRFSLTLPSSTSDGALTGGYTTLEFAIVTGDYLRRRVPPATSALALRSGARFYLAYLGTQAGHEPPLLQMYRVGCFFDAMHATGEQRAARAQLLPPDDWPASLNAYALFGFANVVDTRMATRCFRAGITLIPIAQLHFAVTVGRALARSVLAGARIGEAMQQRADTDAFRSQRLGDARTYFYDAIPKLRTSPEPYRLNAADFECIVAVAEVCKANGWSIECVQPAITLRQKCQPAKYLYQLNGHALSLAELNLAVRLPLWPRLVRSHDLRHGQARYLRSHGVDQRDIAIFLHHDVPAPELPHFRPRPGRSVSPYTTPTDQMLAETHARINAIVEMENEPPFVQPTPPAGRLRASQPRRRATVHGTRRAGHRQPPEAQRRHQLASPCRRGPKG